MPKIQPAARYTILLVEDERMVRNVAQRALESAGYRVWSPTDSTAALALLREQWAAVDLLLTDVAMPGLSGPELARLARQLAPTLPIRFMSGFVDEEQQARLLLHSSVLAKPFTRQELQRFVAQALASCAPAATGAEPS